MKEVTSNCTHKKRVRVNIWNVFHKLLEVCEKVDYRFLINEVASANEYEKEQVRKEVGKEILDLQMQTK